MPRKHRRREKRRTAQALTWKDLSVAVQLDMMAGWSPGGPDRPERPFTTWSEFLEVWEQVREEAFTGKWAGQESFAENLRRGVLAGESPENVAAQISREGEEEYLREMYQGLAEYGQTEGTEDEFVEFMTRSEDEGHETYRNSPLTQTEDI